jgi:RNA polymerase sigma-70 factor (ECF subfamily)
MSSATENNAHEETCLLAAIAAGDRDAFRRLYARYSTPLFSLALRFVGDTGAAEEALQDAFVKIWHRAADYDERKSRPFTWAVTLLRRTCIDQLRRRGHRPALAAAPGESEVAEVLSIGETVRQSAEANETSERVRTALATLPKPRREALDLALYSTLTHAEIAERLGQPVGTIKTWIRRGLLELRDALKETVP